MCEKMYLKKSLMLLSLISIALLCIGSVVASEDNIYGNNLTVDSSGDLNSGDESVLGVNGNDYGLVSSTIDVDEKGDTHNEMSDHTIRNAIQVAGSGDTIIVNGQKYEHVHVTVNKKLTIKSEVGTVLSPCSSTADSGYHGIFYLTSAASGTVIEGFNFIGNGMLYSDGDYGILISGASNVVIRNCTFSDMDSGDAIRLENANNAIIDNVAISNAIYGVNIKDSNNVLVENSDIKQNKNAAVSVAGSSENTYIKFNNLTNNGFGVSLTSSDNVNILSNYIAFNDKYGVYVNCPVVQIKINGNFFNQNKLNEVYNDDGAKDSFWKKDGEKQEEINNNYMIGVGERAVYRSYSGGVFLGYVFEINENVDCPVIYFTYGKERWAASGNYELQLSNITQLKKGIYSISIVDENGNIAGDLSSVPVTFYLNKVGNSATPQEGDVYKTVMMKNGTATVRFYQDDFNASGNVVTAVVPTPGTVIDAKVSKTFAVDDADIPGNPSNTTLAVSNLNTYPNSNQQLTITLLDSNSSAVAGENIIVRFNSKVYNITTDANGKVNVKVSISKEGTYIAYITYPGDEVDFLASSAQAKVVVKKQTSKIVSSNVNMIPKMAEYYSVTLKDASGKVIANKKVIFKVNGKTYSKKTNSKGVAKVKLKFLKNKKTYKISISFKGTNQYKAVSKTNRITVKYSSKTAKLSTPSITITPKTSKTYTVTLKNGNGKAISKQKVTVKINGKKYTKKTNSKGQASIKVKFSVLKTYKVSASYKGSKIYKKASSSGKIKVAKTATKITAPNVSLRPNDAVTYTVTLKTGSGKAISKQKMTIKVNGRTYTKTTNTKGQASLSVKFSDEKSYGVNVNYKGNTIYKASKATGKINVAKLKTQIESYNRTFSGDAQKEYPIALKDNSGNPLINQKLICTIGNETSSHVTDENGQVKLDLSAKTSSFIINVKYEGNDRYKESQTANAITISDKLGVTFVDGDLPNAEIQNILNSAPKGSDVEFLGDYYFDIALDINNDLNIYCADRTILNAKQNSPVFRISANNVNITDFSIQGNSGDAVIIINSNNVVIQKSLISNHLAEEMIESYVDGSVNMPGYGVSILNSSNVILTQNDFSLFESGIFLENSNEITMDNNTLMENNYGIKYGLGVANTEIINNEISQQTGLFIMTVPEGPTGYGIYLNNSAVNVTINNNHIYANHLGISLDANYSTGIVITQNTITDNVLEGIRFNAGYGLAENAVEPIVTDNAIYRNARGPSMMILGELSANPDGIYGSGLFNSSNKLQIDANWYGTNNITTWDNDTGNVGYGTMCPRINTTAIKFNNITYADGNYSIVFYKNGEVASNLSKFDMYATLNRGTDNQSEVIFDVVNGVGTFNFNSAKYNAGDNIIEISIGSLIDSTSRVFKVTYAYEVPQSEIPAE